MNSKCPLFAQRRNSHGPQIFTTRSFAFFIRIAITGDCPERKIARQTTDEWAKLEEIGLDLKMLSSLKDITDKEFQISDSEKESFSYEYRINSWSNATSLMSTDESFVDLGF